MFSTRGNVEATHELAAGSSAATTGAGALVALLGASCLTAMAATAITPSLPGLADAFAETPNAEFLAKLALTLPALVIALSASLAGALVDRLGARAVLVGSALLFSVAGSAGLHAPDMPVLLAGRALLGIAIAGMSTGTLALVGALYRGEDRQSVIGYQGAASSFGGMAFLVIGGVLAGYGWRWPFAIYLLALLLIPLMLTGLPRRTPVAAVTAAQHDAAVDWPVAWFAFGAAFLGMVLFYVIPVQLPFHLVRHGIVDPALAGYALSLCTCAGGVAAVLYRHLRKLMSPPMTIGLAFLLIGIGQGLALAGDYPFVLAGMAAAGTATGLLIPSVNGMALAASPAGRHGFVAGGATTCLFFGQFVAPFTAEIAVRLSGDVFLFTSAGAGAVAALVMLLRMLDALPTART